MFHITHFLCRKKIFWSDEKVKKEYHIEQTTSLNRKWLVLVLVLLIWTSFLYRAAMVGEPWKARLSRFIKHTRSPRLTSILAPETEEYPGLLSETGRIVAIGDLHGDLENARLVLKAARVIDSHDEWVGGNATLVQLGDMVDRGTNSIEIVRLFMKLRDQADKAGGKVINLLGNHEILNLMGDHFYVNEDEMERWGVTVWKSIFSNSSDIGKWLINSPTIVKVRDTVFVHAGIRPTMAINGIDVINKRVNIGLVLGDYEDALFSEEGPH